MPHEIELEAEHVEVLRGIERCPHGRAWSLEDAVSRPTPAHRKAFTALHRAQYVHRRWCGFWLDSDQRAYYFVTRPGKFALGRAAAAAADVHTT